MQSAKASVLERLCLCLFISVSCSAPSGLDTDSELCQEDGKRISLIQARTTRSKDHLRYNPGTVPNASKYPASPWEGKFMLVNSTAGKQLQVPDSKFHQVVGPRGVLMITLARRGSYIYCEERLRGIGIHPTPFQATDGSQASPQELGQGCPRNAYSSGGVCDARTGEGCVDDVESAIAESHRQALEEAQKRWQNWTAIFEDDVIPVMPPGLNWDYEFGLAWARLPASARIIRLSWCLPSGTAQETEPQSNDGGRFQWISQYTPGGCTAAYMVHKEIIPELLRVFPFCCAVDCCYEWDYFAKGASSKLVNLAFDGGDDYISSHEYSDWGTHHGVLMQAKSQLPSTRR